VIQNSASIRWDASYISKMHISISRAKTRLNMSYKRVKALGDCFGDVGVDQKQLEFSRSGG
jgi:hypothetical protein